MLARSDLLEHLLDTYGTCDRDVPARNDCYWGHDAAGRENGCLKTGWRGRACRHWHPIEGNDLVTLLMFHEYHPVLNAEERGTP